jgi:hypothetical protein
MSAKFLGMGFKPHPKNNPPKGGGLNPLCFGSIIPVQLKLKSLKSLLYKHSSFFLLLTKQNEIKNSATA